MGWSLKSLIPKNTILGKALSGDVKGAISSGINYVKSGELLTDVGNISTGNVAAIGKKAITGYNGNGNLLSDAANSVLNKGTNITSLKPSNTATAKAENQQAKANVAAAVGSGVPLAVASKLQDYAPSSVQQLNEPTPSAPMSNESPKSDDNTLYYVIGGVALVMLLTRKKTAVYRRRVYKRATSTYRKYASKGRSMYNRYKRRY